MSPNFRRWLFIKYYRNKCTRSAQQTQPPYFINAPHKFSVFNRKWNHLKTIKHGARGRAFGKVVYDFFFFSAANLIYSQMCARYVLNFVAAHISFAYKIFYHLKTLNFAPHHQDARAATACKEFSKTENFSHKLLSFFFFFSWLESYIADE